MNLQCFCPFIVLSFCLLIFGCGPALSDSDVRTFTGPTMGTRYTVRVVCGRDPSDAIEPLIESRLDEINRQMSTYDPESELSRFNASETTDWFSVSRETAIVVDFALQVAKNSSGAFDPTIGPVVNLWGFGPDGRRGDPPDDHHIQETLATVGFDKLESRSDPPALRKSSPSLQVDLSAIAKGYAVDAVGDLLSARGFESFMVEIGGEVLTSGEKPRGQPWRIGLEEPDSRGREIRRVVELAAPTTRPAIATSGDYRNYFTSGGVRYSHTIDPTAGRPVTHELSTVTVRASTCMEADALATALLVMGPDDGYDWADANDIAALFGSRQNEQLRENATKAWVAGDERTRAPSNE